MLGEEYILKVNLFVIKLGVKIGVMRLFMDLLFFSVDD